MTADYNALKRLPFARNRLVTYDSLEGYYIYIPFLSVSSSEYHDNS
jgi:hypothetical protein